MNRLLAASFTCIGMHLGAADMLPNWAVYTLPTNDGSPNDVVYVHDTNGNVVPEIYDTFYCSLADTIQKEDATFNHYIKSPIFVQLCVQASKAQNIDKGPFQTLIQRIKTGVINPHVELVCMTNKDMHHRLLCYIPKGQEFSLVNDRKIQILFTPYRRYIDNNYDPSKDHKNPGVNYVPRFREGSKGSTGRNSEPTGEIELISNRYDFTSQPQHHAAVMVEFNTLIS